MPTQRTHHLEHARDRREVSLSQHLVITSAPGYVIFIDALHNGRWQTVTVDPGEHEDFAKAMADSAANANREIPRDG